MYTVLYWIGIVLCLTIAGNYLGRLLFWISSVLWEWGKQLFYYGRYWFKKGTTIRDIYCSIKYKYGAVPIRGFEEYTEVSDDYGIIYMLRWIPGINIFYSGSVSIAKLIGFSFAVVICVCRICAQIIIVYIVCKLWDYIFKYIWEVFWKGCKIIWQGIGFIKLDKFVLRIKDLFVRWREFIMELQIA